MEMTTRLSAAERREDILEAAVAVFAADGYEGASTEDIAKAAGISQPYLFRLFGTKKELFKATVARCMRETLELFQRAAEGKRGPDAVKAIGDAYQQQLEADRTRLRAQMQAYAACEDPEIREVVRAGYGDLVAYVRRVSGADWPQIFAFFGTGMLLNVLSSMQIDDNPEPWMTDLLSGCGSDH